MRKSTFWISVLFVAVTFILPSVARGVTVSIDPTEQVVFEVDEVFNIDVKVTEVTNLFGFQFDLAFDPTALQATAVEEGDFLKSDGESTFWHKPEIDNDAGALTGAASTKLIGAGIDGEGVLATITFKVIKVGESALEPQNVKLSDPDGQLMRADVISGSIVTEEEKRPPVIREHSPESPVLALQANYNSANAHGHVYIDIWNGSLPIEAGQFLEYQVAMFSGNPSFQASVDLHTSDGETLRDAQAIDGNGVGAGPTSDLSEYARDEWYHRKISLDALAGKTVDGVMLATSSDKHNGGLFRAYFDNIQITDGERILASIYIDKKVVPSTQKATAGETNFGGVAGMSDYSVQITSVTAVNPKGKLNTTWGEIKTRR